jgi:hypothetical protein
MEFLSDTARKEKRSLLAPGSAGILVALIGIDQTTIELAPLKLSHPILPKVIVWSLLLTIAYLLSKFCFSYFYEQFHSELKSLAAQISEGKTVININREEQEILHASRNLREQQKTYQLTQEKEKRKLEELQATMDSHDLAQETALKVHDEEQGELEEALRNGPQGHSGPFEVVHVPSLGLTMDRRGGSGNSDSMISGSLASPSPPGGGAPKERGNETYETESRSHLQGAGRLSGGQRR